MALDPYAPCPCGSGKKFKWCCQPVHFQIDRAFEMDREGQHERCRTSPVDRGTGSHGLPAAFAGSLGLSAWKAVARQALMGALPAE